MRFKSLTVMDFRGIRELSIDFEPGLTVIFGRNGAGKTSILDALGELARLCVSRLKSGKRYGMVRELSARDARLGASGFALDLTGDIVAGNEEDAAAEKTIEVLNLNHAELRRERKEIRYRLDGLDDEELGLADFVRMEGGTVESYAHMVCQVPGSPIPWAFAVRAGS